MAPPRLHSKEQRVRPPTARTSQRACNTLAPGNPLRGVASIVAPRHRCSARISVPPPPHPHRQSFASPSRPPAGLWCHATTTRDGEFLVFCPSLPVPLSSYPGVPTTCALLTDSDEDQQQNPQTDSGFKVGGIIIRRGRECVFSTRQTGSRCLWWRVTWGLMKSVLR